MKNLTKIQKPAIASLVTTKNTVFPQNARTAAKYRKFVFNARKTLILNVYFAKKPIWKFAMHAKK